MYELYLLKLKNNIKQNKNKLSWRIQAYENLWELYLNRSEAHLSEHSYSELSFPEFLVIQWCCTNLIFQNCTSIQLFKEYKILCLLVSVIHCAVFFSMHTYWVFKNAQWNRSYPVPLTSWEMGNELQILILHGFFYGIFFLHLFLLVGG